MMDKNAKAARTGLHLPPDLKSWTIDKALPLWASTGWDSRRGGFHERLSPEGKPELSAIRRLRVQARQIYVYAHAAHLGWYPDGKTIAMRGFDYLIDKGHAPDGQPGFVHLLTPEGGVENGLRDSYDHMFVLLATSWLAAVSGDAQVRHVLDKTLAFIDAELTDAKGLLFEGKPASLPRRQNPNMHAFEAMMALHASIGHPEALERANRLLAHFMSTFLDPETETVREFFSDDWQSLPAPSGTSVEPGHLVEWTWLLRRHEAMCGHRPGKLASAILDKALSMADQKSGRFFDEADKQGVIRKRTSRTWPHTELAKAWLAETEAGRPGAREKAIAALHLLQRDYLDPAPSGCWIDQLDQEGGVISDHIPASTFYHVFVAAVEADRVLGASVHKTL
jgi:mannose/cellobiose epimerase-like protein (N-acyl-D-glucosamine 2-epimerase family)